MEQRQTNPKDIFRDSHVALLSDFGGDRIQKQEWMTRLSKFISINW